MRGVLVVTAVCSLVSSLAVAQDAAQVDPNHMKVETETEQVRVLRYHYGPHEAAALHSHPNTIDIALANGVVRLTMPSGESVVHHVKAGDVHVNQPTRHVVQNLGDTSFEGILIELKCPPVTAASPSR